ncbi:hypothetical protein JSMCR1_p196 (plasmid) [Escherichia coli]|uniref:Uncharacterized protein n=1 Tax=Escherichia coli TaxID=562 RepID=A0A075M9C9_ECOLX|nr:hypothetical protein [Escherichia coli]AIF78616.1 hypothetical protein [Escherichia coli]ATB52486.1 hypothetical protein [Escherichia coli]AVX49410.1 hypothetical protein [Escherichia coli]AWF76025.1 hypothetical protein [Escherichia coli]
MQPTTTSGNIITQSFIFRFGPPFDFSFNFCSHQTVIYFNKSIAFIKFSKLKA